MFSGWVPRREFKAELRARDREAVARREAQDSALALARGTIESRLERLNELRDEVVEDRGEYVRHDTYAADMKSRDARIAGLENWQSKATGIGAVLIVLSGAISAVVARLFG